jgi:geranylgeranyl diphosphate synthase type II
VEFAPYLADCRRLAIDEIRRLIPQASPYGPVLYDLMLDYPLRGAKGLRPALCLATCRALGGGLEAAVPTAAVLELYHNAFLIHDDVEDGSELRRDRPTLHREHGVPIAVNVGDGMLALALEPLLDNTRLIGVGKALRILQVIVRMARETAEGQALELDWVRHARWDVSDDEYRTMVVKKTAWYSFIAPVTLGAIIAGASDAQISVLQGFALELGIAFQIRDDVLNLVEAHHGKEPCGDLWEGKHTLILLHALRSLTAAERAEAMAILARPRPRGERGALSALVRALAATGEITPAGRARLDRALAADQPRRSEQDVDRLAGWVGRAGSIAHASAIGREHAQRARAALDQADDWLARSVHRDLLHGLTAYTVERDS